jgi:hypothetical protein
VGRERYGLVRVKLVLSADFIPPSPSSGSILNLGCPVSPVAALLLLGRCGYTEPHSRRRSCLVRMECPVASTALRRLTLSGHECCREPKRAANRTGCEHGTTHSEAEHQWKRPHSRNPNAVRGFVESAFIGILPWQGMNQSPHVRNPRSAEECAFL